MKKILTLSLVLFLYSKLFGQVPLKDGKGFYEEVVTLDTSFKKESIITTAKTAVVTQYRNTHSGIVQEDKEAGKLVMNVGSTLKIPYMMVSYFYDLKYTIDVSAKDGKYRMQVVNIEIVPAAGSMQPRQTIAELTERTEKGAQKKFNKSILQQADEDIRKAISSLKEGIAKKANDDF